ncbi:MAG: cytochrome c-type biogenesis protein CcmH [Actinobacteria bacterium]|nr:cytochrome c-type biogenesis protein CcmH [Actinomycetota bacterium]
MRRLPTLLALALALVGLLAPLAAAPATAAAAPEVNINEIEAEVMCPVCGTLLELAESPQAQREKAFIARLIGEGKDKAEIKNALVAQYGNAVLALPQSSGFDLSAYVVPIIAFVVAALALGFGVYRWRRSSGPPDERPASARGPTESEQERLDADLARYDL